MEYQWLAVNGVSCEQLEQGHMLEVVLPVKKLTLLKTAHGIYAFAATCPHAGARLCEGHTDIRGQIVCPLHHYRFDPATGRNTSGEGYHLKTYPVDVRDGIIYIGITNNR